MWLAKSRAHANGARLEWPPDETKRDGGTSSSEKPPAATV